MCKADSNGRTHAGRASAPKVAQSGDVSVEKSRHTEKYSAGFSKWLVWWVACLQSIASSGILFGYTAIAVALKKQGAALALLRRFAAGRLIEWLRAGEFSELCDDDDDEKDDGCVQADLRFRYGKHVARPAAVAPRSSPEGASVWRARSRLLVRLDSFIYTVASSLFFMAYLLHGQLLDKCGPKVTATFATCECALT
jgi:hypothetical protein